MKSLPSLEEIEQALYHFENTIDWKTISIEEIQDSEIRPLLMFLPMFTKSQPTQFVYRARSYFSFGKDESHRQVNSFSYPPQEFINEFGRANYPNQSIFYCAGKPRVAMLEVAKNDRIVYIGRWQIKDNDLGDLIQLTETKALENKEEIRRDAINESFNTNDNGDALLKIMEVLEQQFLKEVKNNYEYKYSAFMANRLLNLIPQANGIAYPSVVTGMHVNFALKTDFADNNLILNKVFFHDQGKHQLLAIGIPDGEAINWRDPSNADAIEFNNT